MVYRNIINEHDFIENIEADPSPMVGLPNPLLGEVSKLQGDNKSRILSIPTGTLEESVTLGSDGSRLECVARYRARCDTVSLTEASQLTRGPRVGDGMFEQKRKYSLRTSMMK